MKKVLILFFLLTAAITQAQIYTEVNVGEYAITTNSMATLLFDATPAMLGIA